jgi:hypothetical protein
MNPEKIQIEDLNKLFEYERHARIVDTLDIDELRNFAKLYCKLYLKQQEVISLLGIAGID